MKSKELKKLIKECLKEIYEENPEMAPSMPQADGGHNHKIILPPKLAVMAGTDVAFLFTEYDGIHTHPEIYEHYKEKM